MIEKVNPSHPDKIADRIAGALVDLAYNVEDNPKVAIEVLIGHGVCHVIAETSVKFKGEDVKKIVERIAGNVKIDFVQVAQDAYLATNQNERIRCGDNGIFKGMPLTNEQKELSAIVRKLYERYPTDGKYILHDNKLIACQSNVNAKAFEEEIESFHITDYFVNPLGDWTGGTNVDSGATNRKLGSDMADGVTGGGLHGKDLSKADVSVNIYAFLKAQEVGIALDNRGWANVKDLIDGINCSGRYIDMEILEEIVRTDNKGRYSFNEDKTKIRANQGHSIPVDVELKEAIPPGVLFHGTATRFLDSIKQHGIKPMSRLYVHLSKDIETATKVGNRHGRCAVLVIDTKRMAGDGIVFYLSENGVWLTQHIDWKYVKEIKYIND